MTTTTTKKHYLITNRESGVDMGVYEADDEQGALDAMARDAGYTDHEEVEREIGRADLAVTKVDIVTAEDIVDLAMAEGWTDVVDLVDEAGGITTWRDILRAAQVKLLARIESPLGLT